MHSWRREGEGKEGGRGEGGIVGYPPVLKKKYCSDWGSQHSFHASTQASAAAIEADSGLVLYDLTVGVWAELISE